MPTPFALEEELSRLTERRNALDHAVMYLTQAGEHDLSAKAGKAVYLTSQRLKTVTEILRTLRNAEA